MFNISYVPESICILAKALNIGMSVCFDYQNENIQYRFWTNDKKYRTQFDLPVRECIHQDPPFDFTSFIVTQLTPFINKIEADWQKEKEIEEYWKKDIENTEKVLNHIYGKRNIERLDEGSTNFRYNIVYFHSRNAAEDVLEQMRYILDLYGLVTVRDFYDLSGIGPVKFIKKEELEKVCWTDLKKAKIVRHISGKYMILFPKVEKVK